MTGDTHLVTGMEPATVPRGDIERQAVDSLRGYAYQVLAAALDWVDLDVDEKIYIEVAEDYSIVARSALEAVQVKDTKRSGSVTLNTEGVRTAIAAYIELVKLNPGKHVQFRYFTTSEVGRERAKADRPAGTAGIDYWKQVSAGADVAPLRAILEGPKFPKTVRDFVRERDDEPLRNDLIRNVRWECGQAEFSAVQAELEERLVVLGRDRFSLPAVEARSLVSLIIHRVLEKSVCHDQLDRVLTRAEFYALVDEVTRVSLPRSEVDAIVNMASRISGFLGGANDPDSPLLSGQPGWLIEGATLPIGATLLPRPVIMSRISDAISGSGVVLLHGGSGLGKTSLARAVVANTDVTYHMANFRNANVLNTNSRLNLLFSRIAELDTRILILDDVDHIDDPEVAMMLARVINSMHRRDRAIIITSNREPSIDLLDVLTLQLHSVIECPYFLEDDVRELTRIHGGDPDTWGRLAFHAGGSGHPQLTHAFVIGAAFRGWPRELLNEVIARGFSSDDTDAARESARRRLVSAMSEGARTLLYRLSLTIGPFSRSLALRLGDVNPSVPRFGESFDELIGPWIEQVGANVYRVSPLAKSFGKDMLSDVQRRDVHKNIAGHMIEDDVLNASDADALIVHAILGKAPEILVSLSNSILSLQSDKLGLLVDQMTTFEFFATDSPIYGDDLATSAMLRLAQFKLAAASGDGPRIRSVTDALLREGKMLSQADIRVNFEVLSLSVVLSTLGIANHLENWFTLLRRLRYAIETDEALAKSVPRVESALREVGDSAGFFGIVFGFGVMGLNSVSALERIVSELGAVDEGERNLWLSPMHPQLSDFSLLVNGPWVHEQYDQNFDSTDTVRRYRQMYDATRSWGLRNFSLQIVAAESALLNEYENDHEEALATLDKAAVDLGGDPVLSRARAKVYWNRGDHSTALDIYREIADDPNSGNPIDRALVLREAAINAAKCSQWALSEEWFVEAQQAAEIGSVEGNSPLAVGLRADAGVVALLGGGFDKALGHFAAALSDLGDIDPEDSLQSGFCHHVIRHAILWVRAKVEGTATLIEDQPITMDAGVCSNIDPSPAILERQLGHIDVAWYLLAEAEISAGVDIGIAANLSDRLIQGQFHLWRYRCVFIKLSRMFAAQMWLNFAITTCNMSRVQST